MKALTLLGSAAALVLASASLHAQVGFGAGTTGGAGGTTVTVSNASAFVKYAGSSQTGKYIVKVSGTISLGAMTTIGSNKSILGVGSSAKITKYGIRADGKSNIVIRNITFSGSADDGIEVTNGSSKVWVDHCSFSSNYDGCVDIKRGSDNCTVSNNLFSNHNKVALLGHSDDNGSQDKGKLRTTYFMNYFNGTTQRHPRVRFANINVVNNYYRSIGSYAIGTAMGCTARVDHNYFQSVGTPRNNSLGAAGYADGTGNVLASSGSLKFDAGKVAKNYSFSTISASSVPSQVPANAGVGKVTF